MVKHKRFILYLSAALIVTAALCSACSRADETETVEESESTVTDELADIYAAIEADQASIDEVEPKKPDDIGTVTNLVYKLLSFETPAMEEVTDATVREYLTDNMLVYYTEEVTDTEVAEGDTVDIDYVGTLDGEAFDGGSYEGYELTIGSGTFIDGFEDGLIGAVTGETRVLTLTFPDNYGNLDLAGKETEFTVTVNKILRPMSFEEFDDETAEDLSGGAYTTRDEYLAALEEYLKQKAKTSYYNNLFNNAIGTAAGESDAEVTEEAIEWQLDVTTHNYELTLEQWGTTFAYYLYGMGTDYASFRELMRDSAEEGAREILVALAVCDAEGLNVDDESIARYSELYGYGDQVSEYLDEENLDLAVRWYLAGMAIVDSANVTYTEEGDET